MLQKNANFLMRSTFCLVKHFRHTKLRSEWRFMSSAGADPISYICRLSQAWRTLKCCLGYWNGMEGCVMPSNFWQEMCHAFWAVCFGWSSFFHFFLNVRVTSAVMAMCDEAIKLLIRCIKYFYSWHGNLRRIVVSSSLTLTSLAILSI